MAGPMQTDHVRDANRLALFRALSECRTASRSALSARTGLSLPTVAAILHELGAIGLVRSGGRRAVTGGRPAGLVTLDPDARHVLAVDLSGRRARALRIDLCERVRRSVDGPVLRPGIDAELVGWLHALTTDRDAPPLARLAVAVPGVVDRSDGRVHLASALGWHDVAVADMLEAELDLPVTLENDVNALTVAELGYGAGVGARHAIFVAIGSGIGAGLVVDGRLVRGAHAAAGEIGYARPSSSSWPAASTGDAPRVAQRGAAERRATGHGGPLERELLACSAAFVGDDGRLGLEDSVARDAFDRFARALHAVLHDLACALDPELLVVAWPADPEGRLAERLRERWAGPSPLRIVPGALGSGAAARGVARLASTRVHEDLCRSAGRAGAPSRSHPDPSADAPASGARVTRAPEETRHA